MIEDRDDGNLGDLTNGFIDLTMFCRRLMRLPIRSQLLLFDCCRSRLDLDVPKDDPIGEAFLDGEASAGPDIQQMALFATLPKEVAKGRAGKMVVARICPARTFFDPIGTGEPADTV